MSLDMYEYLLIVLGDSSYIVVCSWYVFSRRQSNVATNGQSVCVLVSSPAHTVLFLWGALALTRERVCQLSEYWVVSMCIKRYSHFTYYLA
jgi:hypothetical protein